MFIHSRGQTNQHIIPDIPKWELESGFDPLFIQGILREDYVDYRDVISRPLTRDSAEGVINNYEEFDLCNPRFSNPDNFIAGSLPSHFVEWGKLSPDKQILEWVKNGVDVHHFVKHFK